MAITLNIALIAFVIGAIRESPDITVEIQRTYPLTTWVFNDKVFYVDSETWGVDLMP